MTRTVKRDENAYARLGWLLVLFGFGGALLWAAFAPLDQGVAVPATVIISGQRKSVQHPLGGVVKHILVRDGQHVEAGEPLIRMEPTQARANVDSLLNRYANARLNQARLQAEYDGRRTLEMPAGLAEQAPLPTLGERLELQRQLLHSRQTALANELSALRANIEGCAPARRVAPDRGQPAPATTPVEQPVERCARPRRGRLHAAQPVARTGAPTGRGERPAIGEQRSLRADPPEHRRGADAHRPTRGGVPQGSQRATGGNPGQCADALGGGCPRRATNCATPRSARRSAATWPA